MSERQLYAASPAEMNRRWAALRGVLAAAGADAVIVQNNNDWLGGYVKWLTDYPTTNGYPTTVIFYTDDLMTVIDMGADRGRKRLESHDPIYRGAALLVTTAAFTSVAYTHEYHAEIVVEELRRRGYQSVGLIGTGSLPHGFVHRIRADLPSCSFLDLTDEIDQLKAVKSDEEIAAIRQCAAMQDEIFTRLLTKIRPGMRDCEVTALAQFEGRMLGSEQGIFLGSSSPQGSAARFRDRHDQNRVIERGDHFNLLIENNSSSGFYTELARTVVFGHASSELKDSFDLVKAAQAYTLTHIHPGALCSGIARAHDAYMRSKGLPLERRLFAHGQGYDLVERPLLRADETMSLAKGMNLAIHPGFETSSVFAVICDNYLVEADGPSTCLHTTDKAVFELT